MEKKYRIFALGDSITSGFNPFIISKSKVDLFSYSDIVANNFKKQDKLIEYNNISHFGDVMEEQLLKIKQKKNLRLIEKSDIIIYSLGATDLLEYLRFFGVPISYRGFKKLIFQNGGQTDKENFIDHPSNDKTSEFDTLTGGQALFNGLISGINSTIKSQNISEAITSTINYDDLLIFIQNKIKKFNHEILSINPHAKIYVLGYVFPMIHFPYDITSSRQTQINNKNFFDILVDLNKALHNGTKGIKNLEFVNPEFLEITNTSDPERTNKKRFYYEYLKKDDDMGVEFYIQNIMTSIGDIHPSSFGHELLGNGLFEKIYKTFDLELTHTLSTPWGIKTKFERLDESPKIIYQGKQKIIEILNAEGDIYNLLNNGLLDEIEQLKDLKELFELLKTPDFQNFIGDLLDIKKGSVITIIELVDKNYKIKNKVLKVVNSLLKRYSDNKVIFLISVLAKLSFSKSVVAYLIFSIVFYYFGNGFDQVSKNILDYVIKKDKNSLANLKEIYLSSSKVGTVIDYSKIKSIRLGLSIMKTIRKFDSDIKQFNIPESQSFRKWKLTQMLELRKIFNKRQMKKRKIYRDTEPIVGNNIAFLISIFDFLVNDNYSIKSIIEVLEEWIKN